LIAAIFLYAALVYNLAEHLENMRFRLNVEPLIWVLSTVALVKSWERYGFSSPQAARLTSGEEKR
jgi:hypothetical protein